jgi:glycosyltransferase involved in cell wall biosynthesis
MKTRMSVTVIIPAYNEERTIFEVASAARKHVDEVIVVDDASRDATVILARKAGAKIASHGKRRGYIESIKTGFRQAVGDLIVTMDADGEHNPEDIPLLVKPIYDDKSDLVLGTRRKVARMSERFVNWLTNFKVKTNDACTGFRAMKRDLALQLSLNGQCTCGIFVLEASYLGTRLIEIPIETSPTKKPRTVAWHHVGQFFHILGWILKKEKKKRRMYE